MNTLEKTKAEGLAAAEHPFAVCFVCTGNTCRSPMAAALLRAKGLRATSAGLFATGVPIAENAVAALEKAGVPSTPDNPYASHRSRGIDEETVEACDCIVGMTSAHALQLMAAFPAHARKITCMPHDIPDPFGGDEAAYDACLAAIEAGLCELFFAENEHENGNS